MNTIKTDACWSPYYIYSSVGVFGKGLRYSKIIRAKTSTDAEIISIIHGALKAPRNSILYNDNRGVVCKLSNKKCIRRSIPLSINAIKLLKSKNISLKWVSRKKTKEADNLARICLKQCEKQNLLEKQK